MTGPRIALLAREVTPTYAGGGIGTYTTTLALGLHRLGADVTVVGRHDGPWTETRDGYRLVYAPLRSLPGRLRSRVPMLADRYEAASEARAALRRLGRFDVVEGPDWLAEALLAPRRSAGVHARHVHGGTRTLRLHERRPASRSERVAELVEAADLRRADVVTAPSRIACRLPDGGSALPRGVAPVLVPMPVDAARWTAPPATETPPVVTLLGRIEARKGPDVLVRAAARLRDLDVVVRLVGLDMPGTDGRSTLGAVHDLAASLDVELDLPGARPPAEVAALVAGSRVVAVPSRYEPYSMAALEALAARRPVVLSDACGAAETLGEADGALVFPQGDDAALAERLRPLLADPAYAARLGEAGRARVEQRHTPEAVARAKLAAWGL